MTTPAHLARHGRPEARPRQLEGPRRGGAAAAVLLLGVAGCTVNDKDPCTPADLSGCIIEKISISGTQRTDEDDALEKIATTESSHLLGGILEGVPVLGVFDKLGVEYERFDRFVLERDLARLERWFRARGYYEARVTAGRVRTIEGTEGETGGPRVQIDIHVDEGRPVVMRAIAVEITDQMTPEDLAILEARGLTTADAERTATVASQVLLPFWSFDEDRYEEAKKRIVRALGDLGFAYAKVEGHVDVDLAAHAADVVFSVETGPPCTFGAIQVDGAGEVPDWVVLEVVDFSVGDAFSFSALENAESAIADLDAFGAIAVTPAAPPEGAPRPRAVPVQISVTPSSLRTVRTGIGAELGDRVAARGFGGWENRNFLGAFDAIRPVHGLDKINLDSKPRMVFYPLKLGSLFDGSSVELVPEIGFRARYQFPLRFEPRTTLFSQGELNIGLPKNAQIPDVLGPEDNILGYREVVGRFGLERRFYPMRLLVSPSFNMLRADPFSYNLPDVPDGLDSLTIRYLELFMELDLRRNKAGKWDPGDSDRGAFASIDLQYAGLGGDAEDVRVRPELRGYLPLSRRLVLAGRIATGLLVTQNYGSAVDAPISIAPLTDQPGTADDVARRPIARDLQILQLRGLFSGGPNSNRGYGYNEIGPQRILDDAGNFLIDPIATGGRTLWEASLELRWRISGPIGAAYFVDASDVTVGLADYRLQRPHVSSGVGLRYMTPVGPLRLDLGVRIPGLQTLGKVGETLACVEDQSCTVLILDDTDPGTLFGLPMAVQIAIGDAY